MTERTLTADEYVAAIQHLEVGDRVSQGVAPASPSAGGRNVAAAYERMWREVEDDPFVHSVRYLTDTILVPFVDGLPRSAARKLRDVPVGVAPIRTLNAHCVRSLNGEPVVVFNPRLLSIMSFYVETQFDAAYIADHAPVALEPLTDEAFRYLVEYFESEGRPQSAKRTLPKGMEEFSMMSAAAVGSEVFAVAHALAHIHAGHLNHTSAHEISFTGGDVLTLHFYEFSADQQSEADLTAWDWYRHGRHPIPLLGTVNSQWSESVPLTYLIASCLIERNATTLDTYSAHLPAMDRLERFTRATVADPQYRRQVLEIAAMLPVFKR